MDTPRPDIVIETLDGQLASVCIGNTGSDIAVNCLVVEARRLPNGKIEILPVEPRDLAPDIIHALLDKMLEGGL